MLALIAISSYSQTSWSRCADFPFRRYNPHCFTINDKIYVGGGKDAADSIYADLWQYTPATNTWLQKRSLPAGYESHGARPFVVNNKAYIVSGWNNAPPTSFRMYGNTTPPPIPSFKNVVFRLTSPAAILMPRSGIGSNGYIGTGYGLLKKDFASYDPATDTWTTLADVPGPARQDPSFFTIGNFCYLGMGNDHYTDLSDFYRYNTISAKWDTLHNFTGPARSSASCLFWEAQLIWSEALQNMKPIPLL